MTAANARLRGEVEAERADRTRQRELEARVEQLQADLGDQADVMLALQQACTVSSGTHGTAACCALKLFSYRTVSCTRRPHA